MKISRETILKFYKNKANYSIKATTPKALYIKGVLVKDYVYIGTEKLYFSPTLDALAKSLKRSELGLLGKLKSFLVITTIESLL